MNCTAVTMVKQTKIELHVHLHINAGIRLQGWEPRKVFQSKHLG